MIANPRKASTEMIRELLGSKFLSGGAIQTRCQFRDIFSSNHLEPAFFQVGQATEAVYTQLA